MGWTINITPYNREPENTKYSSAHSGARTHDFQCIRLTLWPTELYEQGLTGNWTQVTGIKTPGDNHYTMRPIMTEVGFEPTPEDRSLNAAP